MVSNMCIVRPLPFGRPLACVKQDMWLVPLLPLSKHTKKNSIVPSSQTGFCFSLLCKSLWGEWGGENTNLFTVVVGGSKLDREVPLMCGYFQLALYNMLYNFKKLKLSFVWSEHSCIKGHLLQLFLTDEKWKQSEVEHRKIHERKMILCSKWLEACSLLMWIWLLLLQIVST